MKIFVSSIVIACEKTDTLCATCLFVGAFPGHLVLPVRLEHEGRAHCHIFVTLSISLIH